jgi:excisionase family DNA binding protein
MRALERPIPRRGLSRVEAAMYLGISPSKFDELRHSGQIGPAKIIGTRKLFDIEALDQFFDALPEEINQGAEDWQVAL